MRERLLHLPRRNDSVCRRACKRVGFGLRARVCIVVRYDGVVYACAIFRSRLSVCSRDLEMSSSSLSKSLLQRQHVMQLCCKKIFVASFPLFVSVCVYMYCLMLVPFRVVILACAPLVCGCTVLLFTHTQDDCRSPRCASSAAVGCDVGDIRCGGGCRYCIAAC